MSISYNGAMKECQLCSHFYRQEHTIVIAGMRYCEECADKVCAHCGLLLRGEGKQVDEKLVHLECASAYIDSL